jgi:rRNA-processing protein FCF1
MVLLDTSFLMKIFERPLKTFDIIEQTFGRTQFFVLDDVVEELRTLAYSTPGKRGKIALQALKYAGGLPRIKLHSNAPTVDRKIYDCALNKGIIVATVDVELKQDLRRAGATVITCRGNKVVIEGVP